MSRISSLAVASEIAPLIKTGGLADVAAALPVALAAEGVDTTTLVPGYPVVLAALPEARPICDLGHYFGGPARLLAASCDGLDLFVLEAPHLYVREGGPYGDFHGADYPDNHLRFAALARLACMIAQGLLPDYAPDILHAHDWQAALVPAYLHYAEIGARRPPTVLTIHNLAFQGKFEKNILGDIGLPPESFSIHGVEFYGGVGFLKAGLQFADRITTVSPAYAAEIMTSEFGMGLEGLLRARAAHVVGILNGVDAKTWDPFTDARIPVHYNQASLSQRSKNKSALQQAFDLEPDAQAFLIGVVSRLSWQKGLDLLLEALPEIMRSGVQIALLGAGDKALESDFLEAARNYPGKIGVKIGYDENASHLVQAGADVFLVPSRFEPCGLTQLYALRYGAVPVVARVGGLQDTIIDANEMALEAGVATGFQFSPVTVDAMIAALRRARNVFADKARWRRLQSNGMKTDVSWREPARRYAELYRELIRQRCGV
ncbi:glycogen synthase GlgA [Methylocystis heyeri]|uniref:Glycogen synthase n=1 Tax=Methylocystis heyeri TaxID=391905 RepID=A0A6B8KFB4_9HYPH|nr:glycogen synthase GlgA [Methylocystis heyeri]QGM46996.1 glycogen synthase GlgA [Methylocystis heyeri]